MEARLETRRWLAVLAAAALSGCASPAAFECASSAACNAGDVGRCEADGYCSYGDSTCASGRRYGALSGERADACLSESGPLADAATADAATADAAAADAAPTSGRILVPGVLEAEDYRPGGEGVGYHDTTTGNMELGCRADDVDLKEKPDGNCVIGWWATGEWVAYDVTTAVSATYHVTARLARGYATSTQLHIAEDGAEVAVVTIPSTGADFDTLVDLGFDVPLTAGDHVLRLTLEEVGLDLDRLTFAAP